MNVVEQFHRQLTDTKTIEEVAGVFENIASIQVRQIKDRVVASRDFFHQLWSMYVQLRIDSGAKDAPKLIQESINKTAVILISSEETLAGIIDEQLVDEVMSSVDPTQVDFFVIGRRGAKLLRARGIVPEKTYPLPDITKEVNVVGVVSDTQIYKNTVVYFEQFVNIATQQVQVFELARGIQYLSRLEAQTSEAQLIFSSDYIFEPSLEEVVLYLESMMRSTALTELILESRLAQLASRFHTMNQARNNAHDSARKLELIFSRAKRHKRDDQVYETYYSARRKTNG